MFNIEVEKVFNALNSEKNGISADEAKKRLNASGLNKLTEPKRKSFILRFLEQFNDVLILVLLGAALLSVVTAIIEHSYTEIIDAAVILVVVIVNAVIGLVQESKADKAMEALKKITKPFAKIIRDGKIIKIKTEEIVVGDVVVLESGDIVPADLRLFESASLKIEESALTGESVPSEKDIKVIDKTNLPLGDQHNMAFMGSVISYGRGKGVVIATGMNTQMGKIASNLTETGTKLTPMKLRIKKTSKLIGLIILLISLFFLLVGIARGDSFTHAFMLAIAVAVSCIPEGLPAALTVTLSIGVEQMSRKKAIIKKLPAVETLGSTQVICSDKTGTLTLNKMMVQQIYVKNISGYVKDIKNNVLAPQTFEGLEKNKNFADLISCMLLCNDTQLKYENEVLSTVGDPTETALVHYGFLNKIYKDKFDGAYPRISEIPFDSQRKLMTTIHDKDGSLFSYTKGAVDNIVPLCTHILDKGIIREITAKDIEEILLVNSVYASNAQRV